MKRLFLLTFIFITACGPSQKEKEEIAIVTCNIMGESRNMDGALRIKEINTAREKIGEDSFLGSDLGILTAFENGLCEELVLGDSVYESALKERRELAAAEEKKRQELAAAEEKERADAYDLFFSTVKSNPEKFFIGLWGVSEPEDGFVEFKANNTATGRFDGSDEVLSEWKVTVVDDQIHLDTILLKSSSESFALAQPIGPNVMQLGYGSEASLRPKNMSEAALTMTLKRL